MTSSIRTSTIASIFLALLLLPVVSEAQARRAVPRAAPAGRPQTAAVYRAPNNRPYYGGRYYGFRYYESRYYGPRYYGGYYGYPYYGGGYAYYGAGYGFSIGVGFGYPNGYAYGYPYAYAHSATRIPIPRPEFVARLQVTPRRPRYIDGYPAGTVDDFDGTFSGCMWAPAITPWSSTCLGIVSLSGSPSQPGNTLSVRHAMEPLAPGEPNRPPSAPPRRPARPLIPANHVNGTACRCRLLSSARSRCVCSPGARRSRSMARSGKAKNRAASSFNLDRASTTSRFGRMASGPSSPTSRFIRTRPRHSMWR